jgi:hypothetical protein
MTLWADHQLGIKNVLPTTLHRDSLVQTKGAQNES